MLAAPLCRAPGEPPLRGAARWVEAPDGARLRAALFTADGEPRGSVVLSPGRTEPIEKYAEVIGELQARGFTVLVHDWRGQGLSQPFRHIGLGPGGATKGHARGWRLFVADLSRLLDAFAERLPRPWIGLGHSMGGGLTLLAMSEGETRFDAAILSAPMLGVRIGGRSPFVVSAAATVMSLIGLGGVATPPANPRVSHENQQGGRVFTHDAARWARFRALLDAAPDLRLDEQTWGWLQFALILGRRVEALRNLETVPAPVTIVAAARDRVVPVQPQRSAAARLPHGRYVEVEDAFHEILIETDERRAVFWRAFDELADRVCAGA